MSAVVLLLLLPALCSTRPSAGRDPEQLLPLSQGKLDASQLQFLRVAQTAVQYLNYQQGSPSFLRRVVHLGKTSVRVGKKKRVQAPALDLMAAGKEILSARVSHWPYPASLRIALSPPPKLQEGAAKMTVRIS